MKEAGRKYLILTIRLVKQFWIISQYPDYITASICVIITLCLTVKLFVSLPSGHSSVIHLHERWLKDCTVYRDIYEQIDDVSRMPRIDWGPVFNQKQVSKSGLSEHLCRSAAK